MTLIEVPDTTTIAPGLYKMGDKLTILALGADTFVVGAPPVASYELGAFQSAIDRWLPQNARVLWVTLQGESAALRLNEVPMLRSLIEDIVKEALISVVDQAPVHVEPLKPMRKR